MLHNLMMKTTSKNFNIQEWFALMLGINKFMKSVTQNKYYHTVNNKKLNNKRQQIETVYSYIIFSVNYLCEYLICWKKEECPRTSNLDRLKTIHCIPWNNSQYDRRKIVLQLCNESQNHRNEIGSATKFFLIFSKHRWMDFLPFSNQWFIYKPYF